MPKNQTSIKSKGVKGRKRKLKDIDEDSSQESVSVKRSYKNYEVSKEEEEDPEECHLVSKYLSEQAVKNYKVISRVMNEFNCNTNEPEIYCRNFEKDEIKAYIEDNHKESKSGLMYVWGHPGTGKSSIIRIILNELNKKMGEDSSFKKSFVIFNYNGMIFKKLYDFSTELIKDIRIKFYNKKSKNLESKLKQTDDVVDLGNRIQKYFLENKNIHKLVIIDEVDNLSMTESARNFVAFLHSILKTDTNTTIIGIANSVDLLSKVSQNSSKEGELVEKKCIFGPYSERDIVKIINKKLEKHRSKITWTKELIDKKALEYASKKVAKVSGDIRVAFDLIKSCMVQIVLKFREEAVKLKTLEGASEDETLNETHKDENIDSNKSVITSEKPFNVDIDNPFVSFKMVLYLTTTKFGIKSIETIKSLPSHLKLMLKTIVFVFDERNLSKNFKTHELYTANFKTVNKLKIEQPNFSDFWQGLKTLESYGLIGYSDGKNPRSGKVSLKAEVEEIKNGLDK